MSQVGRTELKEASLEIASGLPGSFNESDQFTGTYVIPHGELDHIVLLSATALYIAQGIKDPLLHKKYFPQPTVDLHLAATSKQECVRHMVGEIPFTNTHSAERLARRVSLATEAFEKDANPANPFHIIGVMGVYGTLQGVLAYTFTNRVFLEKMVELMPGLDPSVDAKSDEDIDEILREEYAMQSEHSPDLPPIEEWLEAHKEFIAVYGANQELKELSAQAEMRMLLLPNGDTHPVINRSLFGK